VEQLLDVMELETFRRVPPPGWDDAVCGLGGTIFHSTIWGKYQRASAGTESIFMWQRDREGSVRAAALGLLHASRRPVASFIFRDIELYSHPCCRADDASTVPAFVGGCEAVARRLGCRSITLASVMSGASSFVPSDHGYAEDHRIEFNLDLGRPLDEIWRAMGKDQRERVRRLEREGLHVEIAGGREDLDTLRLAREVTRAKRIQRGQDYGPASDRKFYDDLHEHLVRCGAGRLLVARKGEDTVAALFFATFNGRACSMFSGSTELGYKLGAQSALFWSAVEAFKAEGFVELNRGGVPASAADESDPLHGIYSFKLRLGTTPRLCRSGEKTLSPMRARLGHWRDSVQAWMGGS
jgi:hypothetical protein